MGVGRDRVRDVGSAPVNKADRLNADKKTRVWILKCLLENYHCTVQLARILGTSPGCIKSVAKRYGGFTRGTRRHRSRYILWGWALEKSGLTLVDVYLSTAEELPGWGAGTPPYGYLSR